MKQFIYTLLILGLSASLAKGQSLDAFKNSARQAYEVKDYASALGYSQRVLEEESDNADFLEMAGVSALELCAYDLGESYLLEIRRQYLEDASPLIGFYLAKSQHRQGNHEEAIQLYDQFIATSGYEPDNEYVQLAREKRTEAETVIGSEPIAGVEVRNAGEINNSCASDYALPLFGERFYYSTLTVVDDPKKKCDCANPCRHQLSIYEREGYSGVGTPYMTDLESAGHITFGNEGNRAYFTMCECEEDQYTCALYYRDLDTYSNTWGEPVKLPASINQPGYTVTQPHLYRDPEGMEYLYYVTNYPGEGAKGGMDIWYTIVRESGCDEPINVSEANTEGDEVTPFFHGPTSTLYFSTNGRTSFGGYDFDIYSLRQSSSYWGDPINVGLPFNSQHDDLYFSKNDRGDKAYLSSNREDSYCTEPGSDFPFCCTDIYKVDIELETNLIVRTFCLPEPPGNYGYGYDLPAGSLPNERILNVDLTLRNVTDGISDYEAAWIESGFMHYYQELPLKKDFEVSTVKTGYEPTSAKFNTGSIGKDTIQIDLFLDPIINLEVYFRSEYDLEQRVEIGTVRLVDTATPSDTLFLEEDPNGAYTAELFPYRTYYLIPDTNSVVDQCFEFGEDRSREIITTCEPGPLRDTILMQSAVDSSTLEEPLPLYFDHAIPLVQSYASPREAARDYGAYHANYTDSLRQLQYRQAYCSPRDSVVNFFEKVEENIDLMTFYADLLYTQLRQGGKRVEVTIQGFASASKSGGYSNDDLSARRIDSMRKFLENRFRELSRNDPDYSARDLIGKVAFDPKPRGDTGASDAPKTGTCRIFDVRAANDRRIEVVKITFYPDAGPCSGLPDYDPYGTPDPYQPDNPYQQEDSYKPGNSYERNNDYEGNQPNR